MALISLEGNWLKVNKVMCQMLGYAEKELLETDFLKLTHPEDLDEDLKNVQRLLRNEIETYQMDKRYFHKDGHVIYAHLSVSLIRDSEGNPEYFISQVQDITEKKKAIQSLEESERIMRLAIETNFDGYWDWHIKKDCEYMSPGFWKMFGYEPSEKKHHPSEWQSLVVEEDLFLALDKFNEHVSSGGKTPYSVELRFKHKNGSIVWILCKGRVIEWDQNRQAVRMIGTHTDITKLKEAQKMMSQVSKWEALEVMAAGMAHEINNPLAIINGYMDQLNFILKGVKDIESEVYVVLSNVKKNVKRIATIIKALGALSRTINHDEWKEVLLSDVVKEVLAKYKEKFNGNEIVLRFENNASEMYLHGNRSDLVRAIENLVENSFYQIKNLNKEKWIEVRVLQNEGNILISILDSGSGVKKEVRSKIMQPFFTTKPLGHGVGLGLSISKGIIEQHGGTITLDPLAPNTKFDVLLPAFIRKKDDKAA